MSDEQSAVSPGRITQRSFLIAYLIPHHSALIPHRLSLIPHYSSLITHHSFLIPRHSPPITTDRSSLPSMSRNPRLTDRLSHMAAGGDIESRARCRGRLARRRFFRRASALHRPPRRSRRLS